MSEYTITMGIIFFDDMNDASESDSESDGGQVEIIENAVFDGVTVKVILLPKDESDDEIIFLINNPVVCVPHFNGNLLLIWSIRRLTRHYLAFSVISLIILSLMAFKIMKYIFKLKYNQLLSIDLCNEVIK